ncbi:VirK/YbjX family protein [Bacillus sp. NP157]|nr:VirK/YbjX family protein [Bacillus sp. NP157]
MRLAKADVASPVPPAGSTMRLLNAWITSLHDRNDWHDRPLLRAIRYLLKSFCHPVLHARWLMQLQCTGMHAARRRDGHLLERWQHRWASRTFTPRDRLRRLLDHHAAATGLFGHETLHQLWRGTPFVAGRTTLKDGSHLELWLMAPLLRCLEGELKLALGWHGEVIFSMTLTLCPGHGDSIVGCIQGANTPGAQEAVRALTRACHGLRPKDFLLSMARALSRAAGIETIRGPGNRHHVLNRTGRLKACYDTFWLEAGATLTKDGMFALSAAEPVRDLALVPSKHRSAARARDALRVDMTQALLRCLHRDNVTALFPMLDQDVLLPVRTSMAAEQAA